MDANDETTRDPKTNRWAIWFRRALWVGIAQDYLLGVPALLWPQSTLAFFRQTPAAEPVYVSFAAAALLVLGTLYIPAAVNPYRYPAVAWLSVLARPPGILFFFVLYSGIYPLFGIIDLLLTLVQLPLLLLTFFAPVKPVHRRRREVHDIKAQPPGEYRGASFQQIHDVVWSDPYDRLPYYLSLGPLRPITFFNHSARNLVDKRDLLPYFDKLIHANGICHAGVWEITEPTDYTGYFATGSKGLVIARLSVAGLTVSAGTRRAFGVGGKLFPTLDPHEVVFPANFVTVSHLSGLRCKHVLDIESTNQPTVGLDPFSNLINRVIFRLMDRRPGYRQLYPISSLGVPPGQPVRTPDLMMLKAADDMPRVDERDFRDELRVRNYPDGRLVFWIFVRSFTDTRWNRIGSIVFTQDVASESGDKRFHVWIPRDIPDVA